MKIDIENALAPFQRLDWFQNVGVQDTGVVDILESWPQAMGSCAAYKWEDISLIGKNTISAEVQAKAPNLDRRWNELVEDIQPAVRTLVREKAARIVAENKLPDIFLHCIDFDLGCYCLEVRFAHLVKPGFFTDLAGWYLRGHFPCGWNGDYPKGRLVVF